MSLPLRTTGTGWNIFIRRNSDLARVAMVEDYQSLEITAKYNDVSTWALTMDARQQAAMLLTQPGSYGIYVIHEDTGYVLISGEITKVENKREGDTYRTEVSGVDDTVWLRRRVGHPSPTETMPPYDVQSHDHREGTCSTVLIDYVNANCGPGAIARRRVPHLVMGADPEIGKNVKADMRWNTPLLEALWALSIAGLVRPEEQEDEEEGEQQEDVINVDAEPADLEIGFRIVQQEDDLVFEVYEPMNRTGTVRFSEEFGNLLSYSYSVSAPESNYVYVAGQGTGTDRTIVEQQDQESINQWGLIETFNDQRNLAEEDTLKQKAEEVIKDGRATTELALEPVDTEHQRYGVHYFLGDVVTVLTTPIGFNDDGNAAINQAIREVKLTIKEGDRAPRFKATVGSADASVDATRLFKAFRKLRGRVNNLEAI